MTVKITLLGLDRTGLSLGLALMGHKDKLQLTGFDELAERGKQAKKLGAVAQVARDLPSAVREADMLLLSLPVHLVKATLEAVAPLLKPEAVVLDLCTNKTVVAGWAGRILPENRHYVGLYAALNPETLDERGEDPDAPRPDLFQKAAVAICPLSSAAGRALSTAGDLVQILGGLPYYADPAEVDGILAAAVLLPQLASAALAETVSGQPGWPDIRNLAGRTYARATRLVNDQESAALAEAATLDQADVLRLLDAYIGKLGEWRDQVAGGETQALTARIQRQQKERLDWLIDRDKGDLKRGEPQVMPSAKEMTASSFGLLRLFGGRKPDERD
jgi:prephenate dehydrogenase